MLPILRTSRLARPVLTRWGFDPFEDIERFATRAFGEDGVMPVRVDFREDANSYFLEVDVPGFAKEDLEVTLEDGVLTVSGERKHEALQEGENILHSERLVGRFSRGVRLPDQVKDDTVSAELKNGVLTVTVSKADEVKPRRIEVKSN